MRLMTSMVLGLLIACGDKEAEDTAVEAEEEVTEEVEDTGESEDSGEESEEEESTEE
mgnify:CR=1 FL=1